MDYKAEDVEKNGLLLIHDPTPAIQYNRNYERNASSGCCGRKCCCCKTSWLCCAIVSGAIVLLIASLIGGGILYIRSRLTGTASSEDADEWEKRLTADARNLTMSPGTSTDDLMSGNYVLVSFDENYDEYLQGLGIPYFVVSLIMGSSETMNITRHSEDRFTITTVTDFMTRSNEFVLGEIFEAVWGRNNGIMHCICSLPEPNKMFCTSEERVKGWSFTSELLFSPSGIMNTRVFLTKDVQTKKFYQRQGAILKTADFGVVDNSTLLKLTTEKSPFSDDSEDPFNFDNWDDDNDDFDF